MADNSFLEDSWEARGAIGVTCLLTTFILLAELLCDHRAYKTTLQRLILYYTLLTLVYQVFTCMNAIVQNHTDNDVTLLRIAMYFADAAYLLPAITINYLTYMVLKLGCGHRHTHPRPKSSTVVTETVCVGLALVFSLVWVVFNITLNRHLSFDVFYTVYESGRIAINQTKNTTIDSDMKGIAAQAGVSSAIIAEMVVAVIVLNIAHWKIRARVRGGKVLALQRKTHIIVIAVALIYILGLTTSFGLEQLCPHGPVVIFFALWFPLLNQCNVFILYVTSIRTTNHPLFCLQWKKKQSHDTANTEFNTNPSSHPLNQPSHTVPLPPQYTGAFTTITETSGVYCDESTSPSMGTGETTPLLSNKPRLSFE